MCLTSFFVLFLPPTATQTTSTNAIQTHNQSTPLNEQQQTAFESQKATEEMTEAEREDLELRRRRADGTPVTPETFREWKIKFDAEMKLLKAQRAKEDDAAASGGRKKGKGAAPGKDDHKVGRKTGKEQFSDTTFNLEALEAAAEHAQADPDEEDDDDDDDQGNDSDEEEEEEEAGDDLKEELFDVDDEDLDDLDFDDDDDDDEDVDI